MPLYEYRCQACLGAFEVLVPAGRADQVTCPACGAVGARRLLSVFSSPRAAATASGSDGATLPAGGCCGGGCGHC